MSDLQVQGRKVFKVFNQDFIVDDRYTVTKELGQGAYGIVWYVPLWHSALSLSVFNLVIVVVRGCVGYSYVLSSKHVNGIY
jgi:hypothetical protein